MKECGWDKLDRKWVRREGTRRLVPVQESRNDKKRLKSLYVDDERMLVRRCDEESESKAKKKEPKV